MNRDRVLLEKDRVQKKLWQEAGRNVSGYLALIHLEALKLRRSGLKIRYAH